ncbi:MAG: 6-carboxytetrahydropterin synthase QueD, partial [Deferrisomatales bacterium]|nr:6-carboxytetrahydropterin synthase QueD [Deferrisomatales bacterium]
GRNWMYELKIEDAFAAAHKLREYQGQCESLHGHNWKVEVVVRADRLNAIGLAVDFKELKEATTAVLDQLDHTYLNELPTFREQNPSSELLAKYIFEQVQDRVGREGLWVHRVTAWESDNACASYLEG